MTGSDDELIARIREAFAQTPRPDRELLVNTHCCECAETTAAYIDKTWEEVGLEDLLAGREIALLTPAAWRYYLPAVMIWAIRQPAAVDVIADNLAYELGPPSDGEGNPEWFNPRAEGFLPAQRAAIAGYLDWYRRREEADWAGLPGGPPRTVENALRYWSGPGRR